MQKKSFQSLTPGVLSIKAKISETFKVKWKDFPVVGSHLQSHCSLEPKIQQDVCYSTADTLRQLQQRN